MNVSEIKKEIILIMDEFHAISEKLHLTYALSSGSLLGAIRHKGFIPWDDDMDIIMPREDYDFLLEYYKKNESNEFLLMTPKTPWM